MSETLDRAARDYQLFYANRTPEQEIELAQRDDAQRADRWNEDAIRTLREKGIGFKVRVCSLCGAASVEQAEPCRFGESLAVGLVSHGICDPCNEAQQREADREDAAELAERKRLARADYEASGWERPL